MQNENSGIREDELGTLSLEVLDYADKMSEFFEKMNVCMEKLPMYYHGPACKKLLEYYKNLQNKFPIVRENIKSYSDDLATVVVKMRENDRYISSLFINAIAEMRHEAAKADNIIIR